MLLNWIGDGLWISSWSACQPHNTKHNASVIIIFPPSSSPRRRSFWTTAEEKSVDPAGRLHRLLFTPAAPLGLYNCCRTTCHCRRTDHFKNNIFRLQEGYSVSHHLPTRLYVVVDTIKGWHSHFIPLEHLFLTSNKQDQTLVATRLLLQTAACLQQQQALIFIRDGISIQYIRTVSSYCYKETKAPTRTLCYSTTVRR